MDSYVKMCNYIYSRYDIFIFSIYLQYFTCHDSPEYLLLSFHVLSKCKVYISVFGSGLDLRSSLLKWC